MLKLTLICLAVVSLCQGYSTFKSVRTPNGAAYGGTISGNGFSGGYGGGYSGSGGGYAGGYGGSGGSPGGYGGSFDGTGVSGAGSYGGGGPFPAPFGPFPSFDAFVNPAEFNKLLGGYFEDLQKNYASGISMTYSTPDATAYASSSLTPSNNLYQQQLQSQSDIFNNIRHQVDKAQSGSNGYAPNYASASASYGPGGIHQTASVYPPNPNSPNVDSRFGTTNDLNNGQPGFFGVSTSSFSESSNVDGVEKNRKGAVTTVNDNGKITTYKAGP